MDFVDILECLGDDKLQLGGWHGRAGGVRAGRAMLQLDKIQKIEMARSCWYARGHRAASLVFGTGFCRFVLFLVFLYFGFWDVYGCEVGHYKAMALIPSDVYVGGK